MSTRTPLLSILLILGLTGLVHCQDAFNWSGFYIGGNVGGDRIHYDTGTSADEFGFPAPVVVVQLLPALESTATAFIGGGQLGYNLQFGVIVLGVEGDFDGISSGRGKVDYRIGGSGGFIDVERTFERSWSASGRLRAGVAWKQFLFYGTGGGSLTDVRIHALDGAGPGGFPVSSSSDKTAAGWVAGVGGEYAITKAVSLGLEYRHADFNENVNLPAGTAPNPGGVTTHIAFRSTGVGSSDDQVTLRINFLFSSFSGR